MLYLILYLRLLRTNTIKNLKVKIKMNAILDIIKIMRRGPPKNNAEAFHFTVSELNIRIILRK